MAGLIDQEAEISRLEKEIGKLEKDVARIGGKLGNDSFVSKAPAEVVAKEQNKLEAQQQALATLEEQLTRIRAL